MGRPKNPNALTPAQRKARERERKGEFVRLHLEVEVYAVRAIDVIVNLTGRTRSEVVSELVRSYESDGLPLTPAFVTRDCPAVGLDVTLMPDVAATLNSFEGWSASSVVEILVNRQYMSPTIDMVGGRLRDGHLVDRADVDSNHLFYVHPSEGGIIVKSTVRGLLPSDGHDYTVSVGKYDRRRDALGRFAHAASVNRETAENAASYGNEMIDNLIRSTMNASSEVDHETRRRIDDNLNAQRERLARRRAEREERERDANGSNDWMGPDPRRDRSPPAEREREISERVRQTERPMPAWQPSMEDWYNLVVTQA